ncbi:MAG: asparagine synthase (glutamine-hydrolyzing), partial [Planctomycetota bacterium]
MCGITGFTGARADDLLTGMVDALHHRGPDGQGCWSAPAGDVHLGHARLAIIDLADGAQPMHTADGGLTVVFNGEIYNHPELRTELEARGHRFRTDHSDTEVLLHGYREWGADLCRRLNGMWAFALYDREARTLFLSRDRYGQKPLYYARCGEDLVFASELTALRLHPGVEATVSRRALRKYFAYGFIPAPLSLYEGVHKLPGGCLLRFDLQDHTLREEAWWRFELEPRPPEEVDEEAAAEELRELLDRAVRRRLMADVPLGIFLSGGVDSTTVAALVRRTRPDLACYSIGFDEPSFDESAPARAAAGALGVEHRLETLSLQAARELLPELASGLDEPVADSSLLPTYLLCRSTRREVTVALSGDGADELFAGYDPFRALRAAEWYARLTPRPVHRALRLLAAHLPTRHANLSFDFKVKRTLRGLSYPPGLWNPVWLSCLEPGELARWFGEPVTAEDVYEEAIAAWDACPSSDPIDRTLTFYTRFYLQEQILPKVDRCSMRHGLEVRSPFLDADLAAFVQRLPTRFKFRQGRGKVLLHRAVAGMVPGFVLQRPKKGFGTPVGPWFRNGDLVPPPNDHGVGLNAEFLAECLGRHQRGESDE